MPVQGIARNGPAKFIYRLDRPATGKGVLDVEWTDAYKRRVAHLSLPVQLVRGSEVTFALDMRRAIAIANHLKAHVTLASGTTGTERTGSAEADFIARPPAATWSDYQIIMWQDRNASQWAALKRMGVTAGKTFTNRRDDGGDMLDPERIAPLLQNDLRWYVENIATDFYSAYHRWSPGRPVNWRFQAAKQRYRANPADRAAFIRHPSLSDPAWLEKIRNRLTRTVRAYAPYRPLYYSLGDETGIADLAAFWDFDLSDDSLRGMRAWLRGQYGTLDALNREWGSHFTAWDPVVPATTAEIMRRSDGNFSAWADFKAWMDVAFVRALWAGTDAVHAADPFALAAIEGAQVPGWGGYDYSLLAHAVDLMEPYDFGNNIAIVRSLNPRMVIVTTTGPGQAHEDWRMLLNGSRGLILWDPQSSLVDAEGRLGPWGRAATPRFQEFRGGLGSLLINSRPHTDPIAILYSPASMRTQWMLDHKPYGDRWIDRTAESEYEPNALRSAVAAYSRALVHLGLQPRFLSAAQLGRGELLADRFKVLVLPHTIALSRRGAGAIHDFAARGGMVIADTEPGIFDQHSRRLPKSPLSDLFGDKPAAISAKGKGGTIYLAPPVAQAGGVERIFLERLRRLLQKAGVTPGYALTDQQGETVTDVEIHSLRNGGTTIIGLQRDSRPAANDSARPARRGAVILALGRPRFVYDIRRKSALGRIRRVPIRLGDIEPAIFAISDNPPAPPEIAGPGRVHAGDIVQLQIRCPGAPADSRRIFHVEVSDPAGNVVPYYTANVIASGGAAHIALPFALDAVEGTWTVRITGILTGWHTALTLRISRP